MKKRISSLLLALVLALSMSATAFAEGTNSKATITDKLTGATATFDTNNPDIIKVTFTSESLTDGGEYLILMVKTTLDQNGQPPAGAPEITEKTILYIDQVQASGTTVTFNVYPSSMQDSVILIAGAGVNGEAGPIVAAIVDAAFILGDINSDGSVNGKDIVIFNQHLAKIITLEGAALSAADINKDNSVDGKDIVIFNQYLAKIIASLG